MQTDYKKILWIVAFALFAAISCWATTESLHLLLSSWPKIICWAVSIGFFLIASLGTKMIVDSLNNDIYLDHRGVRLVGGVLLVLIFWLVCSMPTNTHTFFYRTVINDKVSTDIATTQGYLNSIRINEKNNDFAEKKIEELDNKINAKLIELEAEIMSEALPGDGPNAKGIRHQIAQLLEVDKIEKLPYTSTSKQARQNLVEEYRKKILQMRDIRAGIIRNSIKNPSPDQLQMVDVANKNLSVVKDNIANGTIDPKKAKDLDLIVDKLNDGYNAIRVNKNFVLFNNEEDEALYTVSNPTTKVKRMVSVYNVWVDYLHGEYRGLGFIFWIIISILVDIAAFIFFDMAFKR